MYFPTIKTFTCFSHFEFIRCFLHFSKSVISIKDVLWVTPLTFVISIFIDMFDMFDMCSSGVDHVTRGGGGGVKALHLSGLFSCVVNRTF
jgi:hypothetical protein